MRVGRILYPVQALGPGERLGIWLSGCERRCIGCANPELWEKDGKEIPFAMFLAMCRAAVTDYSLSGITVTGGEPLLQAEELDLFLDGMKDLSTDILLFTGFTMEEIRNQNRPVLNHILTKVSVLVDGEYRQEENHGEILRGSSNQVIHYLDPGVKEEYENYIHKDQKKVDSFAAEDGIISVGIHPAGFLSGRD